MIESERKMKQNYFKKLIANINSIKTYMISVLTVSILILVIDILKINFIKVNFIEQIKYIASVVFKSFLYCTPVLIILALYNILREIGRMKALSKTDFINTERMYREIIDNHSVLSLIYVDKFKINLYKDISVLLLSLELKKKIKIENNKINIIDNPKDDLRISEQYIYDRIYEGKLCINSFECLKDLEKLAIFEAKNNNLIKEMNKKESQLSLKKMSLISIFLIISSSIGAPNSTIIILISILVLFFCIVKGIIDKINKIIFKIEKSANIKRTNTGEEINRKLEGLKKYLKNYSLLNDKEKDALNLWDEYLIYSVMFEHNKKIIEDMKKLIIFK